MNPNGTGQRFWRFLVLMSEKTHPEPITNLVSRERHCTRPPDIKAALDVLSRREATCRDTKEIDLSQSDLRGAVLPGALHNDLRGAVLHGAELRCANFNDADLTEVHLNGAHLNEANLKGALLNKADLTGADLTETILYHADLTDVLGLTQGQVDSARGDSDTRLPSNLQMPATWKQPHVQ